MGIPIRLISLGLAAGLLAACATAPAAQDGNLLKNPGFELGKTGWADWDNASVEPGAGRGGSKALRLGGRGEGGMGQIVRGVSGGERYELSGWGRTADPAEPAYLGVDCLDGAGKKLLGGKFTATIETLDFTNRAVRFSTPPGTDRIQVYAYNNFQARADVFLDDLSLIRVPGGAEAPAAVPAVPAGPTAPPRRALWVWETAAVLADPRGPSDLLAFCAAKKIDTLYFNSGDGALLKDHPAALGSFLSAAHERGFRVEALDGNMRWVLPENHAVPLDRIREVARWNASVPAGQRFDGIHHDNEPYTLPGFFADKQKFGTWYLELAEKSVALLRSLDPKMTYAVDIPFWYDEAPVIVTYKGVEKPLSFHILDVVDSVAVMDYRDTADGSNGMIQHGMQEVEYGGRVGKPVLLGAETIAFAPGDKDNPPLITFAEEGEAVLNAELGKVSAHFAGIPGFGGVAVHHYGSYRVLKP